MKTATKTCSLDPIPTDLLNYTIINQSLSSEIFPNLWKKALVAVLIKKTNLDPIYENYSPTLNLSFLSKNNLKNCLAMLFTTFVNI